jgi:hypothetical protein
MEALQNPFTLELGDIPRFLIAFIRYRKLFSIFESAIMMNGHGDELPKHEDDSVHASADGTEASTGSSITGSSMMKNTAMTTAATVGVVGVAAVIFEAALIPGMILGVAAALAPTYMPRLGNALNPLFRSTVRSAYKMGRKTREAMSEAREQMNDIVAEVHAEGTSGAATEAAAMPAKLHDAA